MDITYKKTVVITGSTRGFGRELANEFLKKGHNVVVCSKNVDNVQRISYDFRNYDNVLPLVIDVQKYKDCEKLFDETIQQFNHVDILINNAAINGNMRQEFLYFGNNDIENIVRTNILGTMFCCKCFLPLMIRNNTGTIINIEGTGSRKFSETRGYNVYASTKSSITQFTETLRKEYEEFDINFVTLSPGMMHTDILWTEDTTPEMKKVFNAFAECPKLVAKHMVEKILKVEGNKDINYFTWYKIIQKIFVYILSKHSNEKTKG